VSRTAKISALLIFVMLPAGCSSVDIPEIMSLPEFSKKAENVDDLEFPDPADAPVVPDDMRSNSQWDSAASNLLKQQDDFNVPVDVDGDKSDAELLKEINALKAKVKEYKRDDPVKY